MKTKLRNDTEPCFCNSGEKYKDCHKGRETETPMPAGQLAHLHTQVFKFDICLHPRASSTNCGHTIIDAHTIQKAGAISKIVDAAKHLYTFYPPDRLPNSLLKVHNRSWKQASTFRGFCNTHDTTIFTALETQPFIGDEKQCFLVGYRAACHEFYQKVAVNAGNPILMRNLDKGRPEEDQIAIQKRLIRYSEATDQGFKDISDVKNSYDAAFLANDFSDFNYAVISFDGDISVASTGAVMPDFDINGKRLQDVDDLTKDVEGLMFGIVSTPTGGAVVFSWLSVNTLCNEFIESLLSIHVDDIPSIIIEFIFGYVENTYFSKSWWDGLDQAKRDRLTELISIPYLYGNYLNYSRTKFTNWQITNIK